MAGWLLAKLRVARFPPEMKRHQIRLIKIFKKDSTKRVPQDTLGTQQIRHYRALRSQVNCSAYRVARCQDVHKELINRVALGQGGRGKRGVERVLLTVPHGPAAVGGGSGGLRSGVEGRGWKRAAQ